MADQPPAATASKKGAPKEVSNRAELFSVPRSSKRSRNEAAVDSDSDSAASSDSSTNSKYGDLPRRGPRRKKKQKADAAGTQRPDSTQAKGTAPATVGGPEWVRDLALQVDELKEAITRKGPEQGVDPETLEMARLLKEGAEDEAALARNTVEELSMVAEEQGLDQQRLMAETNQLSARFYEVMNNYRISAAKAEKLEQTNQLLQQAIADKGRAQPNQGNQQGELRETLSKLGSLVLGLLNLRKSRIFPFLSLPAELREKVYKHALVLPQPIDFWPVDPPDAVPGCPHLKDKILGKELKKINTALLRVSRQVHRESASILYGYNRFRFSNVFGFTALHGFLTCLGTHCNFLTNISVHYPDADLAHGVSHRDDGQIYEGMRLLCRRFGQTLDSPSGPYLKNDLYSSFNRAVDMLNRLPAPRSFNLILLHNEVIRTLGINTTFSYLLTDSKRRDVAIGPIRELERAIICVNRHYLHAQFVGSRNTDDDRHMGREALLNCTYEMRDIVHWVMKEAEYGKREDRQSYIVKDEKDEKKVDAFDFVGEDSIDAPLDAVEAVTEFSERMLRNERVQRGIRGTFKIGGYVTRFFAQCQGEQAPEPICLLVKGAVLLGTTLSLAKAGSAVDAVGMAENWTDALFALLYQ